MTLTALSADTLSTGDYVDATDEELVACIKKGDKLALDVLVRRYLSRTFRKVRRLVPERDAEDVTQEIFFQLIKSINRFNGKSTFAVWFSKLITNRVADYHRQGFRHKARFVPEDEIPPSWGKWPDEMEEDLEASDIFSQLPEIYHQVLWLKFAEELSFSEIAALLDLTYEAARSRYRRGIRYIAQKLNGGKSPPSAEEVL